MADSLDKAKEVACELLGDRGYSMARVHIDEDMIVAEDDERGSILIVFINENKLSVNTLKDVIAMCEDLQMRQLILVYKEVITPSAKKTLESIHTINVEQFALAELMYNPTKHELSSKHEMADPEEAESVKTKFGTHLPLLQRTDKMVRWYNYKPGSIIRVTRPGGHVVYRLVK